MKTQEEIEESAPEPEPENTPEPEPVHEEITEVKKEEKPEEKGEDNAGRSENTDGKSGGETEEHQARQPEVKLVKPAGAVAVQQPVQQPEFRPKRGPQFLKRLRKPPTGV